MKETKFARVLEILSRFVVGVVFLFSGFVKGVDPMGTSYKIADYMTAWSFGGFSFEWALPMASFLSVSLITLEILIGALMLTGAWRKAGAWILLLMMVFFTVTTLYDAITNKVSDCGCFGDAIKLTNWQTFWKNIALDVPMLVIFLARNWKRRRRFERDSLISLFTIIVMVLFCLWNIKNEPVIDFRPWKVGNQMIPFGEDKEPQSYVTYRDKETGETEEMTSQELMERYKDTTWVRTHEFVDSRVEDPYEIQADGFSMMSPDGEDYAHDIVGSSDYVIIATIHNIDKMDKNSTRALRRVYTWCGENGIDFVILTSALQEDIEAFLYDNNLGDVSYYFADGTAIKTMLRSNPGFVLLKDAKVVGKWSKANVNKLTEFDFEIE